MSVFMARFLLNTVVNYKNVKWSFFYLIKHFQEYKATEAHIHFKWSKYSFMDISFLRYMENKCQC